MVKGHFTIYKVTFSFVDGWVYNVHPFLKCTCSIAPKTNSDLGKFSADGTILEEPDEDHIGMDTADRRDVGILGG